jgi:hypothetical protein
MAFGAAPPHLRSQILVFHRQAYPAELLSGFPHLFERQLFSSQPLQSPLSLGKGQCAFRVTTSLDALGQLPTTVP